MSDEQDQAAVASCAAGSCSIDGGDCGTGEWGGGGGIIPRPDPGESNNTSYVTATPTFGGVRVAWGMPSVNPQGVAFTKVFRNTTADFGSAVLLASVGGNSYMDFFENEEAVNYYYWVQVVTSTGRAWPEVGPALAEKRAFVEDLIDNLTQEIEEGMLSQALQQNIDKITRTKTELDAEIAARIANNALLADAFARVQQGLDESVALIHDESGTWQEGMNALAFRMTTMAAVNAENSAAILTEARTRVTELEALSTRTDQLLAANKAGWEAAVKSEETAQITQNSALASRVDTVQTSLGNQIASVETTATTRINALTGKIDGLWTVRVDVNGLVGGFGLVNNGQIIEAGFDVDRFWIGRAGSKRKPFIVDAGIVYIDEAMIRSLTFDKLRSSDGNLVFENGVLKAKHLVVDTISIVNNAITTVDSTNWNTNISGNNAYADTPTLYVNSPDGLMKTIVNFSSSGNISGVNLSGGDTYVDYTNLHTVYVTLYRNGGVVNTRTIPCWSNFDGNTGLSMGTYLPISLAFKDQPPAGTISYFVRIQIRNLAGYPVNLKDVIAHFNVMGYKR